VRRTLFSKIFLWFWLAATFIGVVSAAVSISVEPKAISINRYSKKIIETGETLIEIYKKEGQDALGQACDRFEQETRFSIFLFKGSRGPLSGRQNVKFEGKHTAITATATGVAADAPSSRGVWYAAPLGNDYTVLAELPPPMPMERFFQPELLGFRLAISFIVGGIFSYFLARSLTKPILQLRKAARRFAGGALTTRVGSILERRKDEIADLGWDFDTMAERIEALVGAQQRLLRDISHELRSPLARLNVALELARRRSVENPGNALDRIERESERLNELIGELLTLTLLESGTEKIERAPNNLLDLVTSIVEDSNYEAKDRNRLVRIVSMEKLIVNGSEEMLRRAIENVIRNAIRYTGKGTEVEVSLSSQQIDEQKFSVIRVRDYGPGVPEELLSQMFKPFYRVEDDRGRLTGGTGIGLAISERSVLAHGGTIKAFNVSDEKGGLLVEISLPASEDKNY
jgi:two-component system sensor histidine kinase CpxA